MVHSRAGLLFTVILVVSLFGFISSCGGGGSTLGVPDPNPGNPQGQNPPTDPQADPPDTLTVQALFNTATNSLSIGSGAGSVQPGATVFVEDEQNFVSDPVTADPSGAWGITEAELPPNFQRNPGTVVRIYTFTADTQRSEPATVTIQGISV